MWKMLWSIAFLTSFLSCSENNTAPFLVKIRLLNSTSTTFDNISLGTTDELMTFGVFPPRAVTDYFYFLGGEVLIQVDVFKDRKQCDILDMRELNEGDYLIDIQFVDLGSNPCEMRINVIPEQ